MGLGNEAMSQW